MDFKEYLQQLANGEKTVDEVHTAIVDSVEDQSKDMIPRSRLNAKNDEIKDLQEEINNRDKQIKDLEKAVKGNEEVEGQIKQLQSDNEKWKEKYQQTQLNSAIKLAVAKDARDADDILKFIDREGLELTEDGKVKGLDDAVKQLRESKSYLFVQEENTPPPSLKGRGSSNQTGSGEPSSVSREDFQKMTYSDRVKLFNENPDLYQKLKG